MSRKLRSRDQINEEYNFHVSQAGHKTTNIQLLEEDVKRLEDEVRVHFEKSVALRKEALKLPPVAPGTESKDAPVPAAEPKTVPEGESGQVEESIAPVASETPESASVEGVSS